MVDTQLPGLDIVTLSPGLKQGPLCDLGQMSQPF